MLYAKRCVSVATNLILGPSICKSVPLKTGLFSSAAQENMVCLIIFLNITVGKTNDMGSIRSGSKGNSSGSYPFKTISD